MRIALYGVATLAIAATFSPTVLTGTLAAAAGMLCETTPFLIAGAIAQVLLHDDRFIAYVGCGCSRGPAARSIPVTLATAFVFGIWIALARFLAAIVVARLRMPRVRRHECEPQSAPLLGGLHELIAAAVFAACASQLMGYVDVAALPPAVAAIAAIALGFAAPCGLGAIAVAAALHARAPGAASAYLCVAGVVDLRAFVNLRPPRLDADATAYILLAAALAIVAVRHGDALVRPALALPLAICAAIALVWALRYRARRDSKARWAPAMMLAGALVTAPPPAYTATETTLNDIFVGERLDFTGRLTHNGGSAALVRYAITCCRADAAPVVVRLGEVPRLRTGTWIRASGNIENAGNDFRLRVAHLEAVAPPPDPFIYR